MELTASFCLQNYKHKIQYLCIRRNSEVRLLVSQHRNQTMQVKWDTCLSDHFTVTIGLRWGVLSPYLFAVYFG